MYREKLLQLETVDLRGLTFLNHSDLTRMKRRGSINTSILGKAMVHLKSANFANAGFSTHQVEKLLEAIDNEPNVELNILNMTFLRKSEEILKL